MHTEKNRKRTENPISNTNTWVDHKQSYMLYNIVMSQYVTEHWCCIFCAGEVLIIFIRYLKKHYIMRPSPTQNKHVDIIRQCAGCVQGSVSPRRKRNAGGYCPVQLQESYSDGSSMSTAGRLLTLLPKSRQETPKATKQCHACRQRQGKEKSRQNQHTYAFKKIYVYILLMFFILNCHIMIFVCCSYLTHQVAHKAQIGHGKQSSKNVEQHTVQ